MDLWIVLGVFLEDSSPHWESKAIPISWRTVTVKGQDAHITVQNFVSTQHGCSPLQPSLLAINTNSFYIIFLT